MEENQNAGLIGSIYDIGHSKSITHIGSTTFHTAGLIYDLRHFRSIPHIFFFFNSKHDISYDASWTIITVQGGSQPLLFLLFPLLGIEVRLLN